MSKQKRSEWKSEGKLRGLDDAELKDEFALAEKARRLPDRDELPDDDLKVDENVNRDEPEEPSFKGRDSVDFGGSEPTPFQGRSRDKFDSDMDD